MADVFSIDKRKEIMQRVKSKKNKSTELRMIALFHEYDIKGWRRNYNVKGRPDFVFLPERVAVFVDGCFWHGHDCRNTRPKNNAAYWEAKRARNILHDQQITTLFQQRGWTVIRVWECELKKEKQARTIERIALAIKRT